MTQVFYIQKYMYIILHEMKVFRIYLILDTAIVKFKVL